MSASVERETVIARPETPGSSVPGGLPADLLRDSARRLGIACLVYAMVWAIFLALNNVVAPLVSPGQSLDDAYPWPGNPVAVTAIVASLALFAYTRRRSCDCEATLNLGLWYEVLLAFAIGLVNQWTPNTVGLSWICILVLVHPIIVPNTRGRTLLAALAAASMDPVGLAITAARGVPIPSLPVLVWTYLPNYVCAVIAVVPSQIIRGLGRQVRQARELGSYRLGELLGRGGMGEVYRASHRFLARPAAIKLIRPDARTPGGRGAPELQVRRFRREAEAAASLHSPHTIELYDFGITEDGTFYYVMELLNGLDFETLVERFGPLPPARTIYLLKQVCHSLAEAHAANLIHRDIKPANLYACRMGLEADYVKVLDFGLAKHLRPDRRDLTLATNPGLATGTPAYMAPETASGEGALDWRIDLYGLGCVAYWLLTGKTVFEAPTSVAMLYHHARTDPVPPSRRADLPIPACLEEIVLACLAKDPARRPFDAEEVAHRFDACEVGQPWTREDALEWWRIHLPEMEPVVRPSGKDRPAASPDVEPALPQGVVRAG